MANPNIEHHPHGPANAEHELKKAYNLVIENGVTHFGDRKPIPGVQPEDVNSLYQHAFRAYRDGRLLLAERWARTAKHLARAFWHEAKIAYLEPRDSQLPFLEGARDEYNLHEYSDTTLDLLDSLEGHIPEVPASENAIELENMRRYLGRARHHLQVIESAEYRYELLRAERIKAAHEYGRVVECMALAFGAAHGNHNATAEPGIMPNKSDDNLGAATA